MSTLDTVEFEDFILNFMIPNPSLECSYVVLSFWPNSYEPCYSYKNVLIKKRVERDQCTMNPNKQKLS